MNHTKTNTGEIIKKVSEEPMRRNSAKKMCDCLPQT